MVMPFYSGRRTPPIIGPDIKAADKCREPSPQIPFSPNERQARIQQRIDAHNKQTFPQPPSLKNVTLFEARINSDLPADELQRRLPRWLPHQDQTHLIAAITDQSPAALTRDYNTARTQNPSMATHLARKQDSTGHTQLGRTIKDLIEDVRINGATQANLALYQHLIAAVTYQMALTPSVNGQGLQVSELQDLQQLAGTLSVGPCLALEMSSVFASNNVNDMQDGRPATIRGW